MFTSKVKTCPSKETGTMSLNQESYEMPLISDLMSWEALSQISFALGFSTGSPPKSGTKRKQHSARPGRLWKSQVDMHSILKFYPQGYPQFVDNPNQIASSHWGHTSHHNKKKPAMQCFFTKLSTVFGLSDTLILFQGFRFEIHSI